MTCRELTQLITDYLDGRLGPWPWISFQFHLGLCGDCRRYLRQMRLTLTALGTLPVEPLAASTRDELLRRFRTWRR